MVQLCLLRSAGLRSNLSNVPVSLLSQQLRYKSLTTSIARGKESDRFAARLDSRGARPARFDSRPPHSQSKNSDFRDSSKREFGDRDARPSRDVSRSSDSTPRREFRRADSRSSGEYNKFDHNDSPSNFEKRGTRAPRDSGDRPSRDFGGAADRTGKSRREFGDDRGPTPSFGRDRESRPRREFGDDRGPKPSFGRDRGSRPRREFGDDRGSKPSFGGDRESRPSRDSNGSNYSKPSYGGPRTPREYGRPREAYASQPREDRPPRDYSGARELDKYPEQKSRPSKHYDTSKDARSPKEYNESPRETRETREPREKEWDPSASTSRAERSGFKFSDTRIEDFSRTDYSLESLPYTTAASEFLYGHSSVLAAIKANRRKLYTLYIHTRGLNREGIAAMVARAKAIKLNVREVDDKYLRAMDKASSGRPHNGFILEASPLPQLPPHPRHTDQGRRRRQRYTDRVHVQVFGLAPPSLALRRRSPR
jgi:21S rRNA (GM2251-2'-O)-methyltransferase